MTVATHVYARGKSGNMIGRRCFIVDPHWGVSPDRKELVEIRFENGHQFVTYLGNLVPLGHVTPVSIKKVAAPQADMIARDLVPRGLEPIFGTQIPGWRWRPLHPIERAMRRTFDAPLHDPTRWTRPWGSS